MVVVSSATAYRLPTHDPDNTRLLLQSLKIDRVMVVGHSMGGMLATRFATQYPDLTERLVLYNPIGLVDARFTRPWQDTDEGYKQNLAATCLVLLIELTGFPVISRIAPLL